MKKKEITKLIKVINEVLKINNKPFHIFYNEGATPDNQYHALIELYNTDNISENNALRLCMESKKPRKIAFRKLRKKMYTEILSYIIFDDLFTEK